MKETCLNKEARLLAIRIRAAAIEGELLAMRLQDEFEMPDGVKLYAEKAYQTLVKALNALADDAEKIASEDAEA